jgi:fucose permease
MCGFALLGMPGAALGVAWPSIASDLSRSLGDLGILTIATGTSYAVMSVVSGSLSKRFSAGQMLVVGAAAGAVGLTGFALAESWTALVLAMVPIGVAGGALDALGNAYVAVDRGPRAMGAIHAAFGFGSMIAPLAMTAILAVGISWRVGFGSLAITQVALGIAFMTIAGMIRMPMQGRKERPVRTGGRRLVATSVWVFFIYAGVEGSTGLWAFTLLTEGQGVSATIAGLAVAGHWGALFLSRVVIGIRGDRMPLDLTISVSVIGIVASLALMWWNPATWVSVLGLVAAGFFNGPVFPFEVLLTSVRFGAEFTPWAVGYQLAAATASIAVVPAVIGVAVNASGPLVIGAMLTVLSIVMALSVEFLRRLSGRESIRVAERANVG